MQEESLNFSLNSPSSGQGQSTVKRGWDAQNTLLTIWAQPKRKSRRLLCSSQPKRNAHCIANTTVVANEGTSAQLRGRIKLRLEGFNRSQIWVNERRSEARQASETHFKSACTIATPNTANGVKRFGVEKVKAKCPLVCYKVKSYSN